MNVYDIFIDCFKYGGIGIVILLTLVQIAPIKINPWSKLAAMIGKAFNKDLLKEISDLKEDVTSLKSDVKELDEKLKESAVIDSRMRILRFGDEVTHGFNHSKDHFQQIMMDITQYNKYCTEHPTFQNNITAITAARIEEDYMERDKNNSFL